MAAAHGKVGRLVRVYMGLDASPLEEVAGCQNKSIKFTSEAIDVTADEDEGFRRLLDVPAQKMLDISITGIVRNSAIKEAYDTDQLLQYFELRGPGQSEVLSGYFAITSYTEEAAHNDKITFSLELQSDGPWDYSVGSP
jgi:TP901-1 family phage major tail protein